MAYTTYLFGFAAVVAVLGVYVYFVGLPAELKRWLEREALERMGENKASYMMKSQLDQIPDSNQRELKDIKKDLGNTLGGGMKNRAGKEGGELADTLTSGFTGR